MLSATIPFFLIRSAFSLVCTTQNIVSCGDSIYSSIEPPINVNHQLIINNSSLVRFDTCNSKTDISLHIEDSNGYSISDPYCKNGDQCGKCKDKWTQNENFTIPIKVPDIYDIIIKTNDFYTHEMYEIKISCSDYAENTTIPIAISKEDRETLTINFSGTFPLNDIWPSDGFTLKYTITDPTKSLKDVYAVFVTVADVYADYHWSNITNTWDIHPIYYIELNTSSCSCIDHTCLDCKQHINVFDLIFLDAKNEVDFTLSHPYSYDVLLIPPVITDSLERCNVSLFAKSTKEQFDPIPINFNLSPNCYTRIGSVYNVGIWLDWPTGPQHSLIITIKRNDTKFCKLCAGNTTAVHDCSHLKHDSFTIQHEYHMTYDGVVYSAADNEIVSIVFYTDSVDVIITKPYQDIVYDNGERYKPLPTAVGVGTSCGFAFFCCCLCLCCNYWARRDPAYIEAIRYKEAYVVDKALILIIGIAQFDKLEYMLEGVRKNVKDLRNLWEQQYKYDVFICNETELYSTKDDIIDFIDTGKETLEENEYHSVIVHIISHGSNQGQSFLSSDLKNFQLEGIRHELADSQPKQLLIKVIFNHVCRGEHNQESISPKTRASAINDIDEKYEPCGDSNWAIVWGNIAQRDILDDGYFTNCICDVFGSNITGKTRKRKYFRGLITEVREQLQSQTDGNDICEMSESLRKVNIRFEPWKKRGKIFKQKHIDKCEREKPNMMIDLARNSKVKREKPKVMKKVYKKSAFIDGTSLLSSNVNITDQTKSVEMMTIQKMF